MSASSKLTNTTSAPNITLIVHNVRSCYNVGSLLRTADGLGVRNVFLTGYTPYPAARDDSRLPHIASKITKQISKTALGAETSQPWEYCEDVFATIHQLQETGFTVAAVEQTARSQPLPAFVPPANIALVVGREVEGIEQEVVDACDIALEIPMFGDKESFNVSVAAAMALYHCAFVPFEQGCYTASRKA